MAPTGGTKVTPRQFLQEKSSRAVTRARFLEQILLSRMIAEGEDDWHKEFVVAGDDVACPRCAATGYGDHSLFQASITMIAKPSWELDSWPLLTMLSSFPGAAHRWENSRAA